MFIHKKDICVIYRLNTLEENLQKRLEFLCVTVYIVPLFVFFKISLLLLEVQIFRIAEVSSFHVTWFVIRTCMLQFGILNHSSTIILNHNLNDLIKLVYNFQRINKILKATF